MGKADAQSRPHNFRGGSKAGDHEPGLFFSKEQLNCTEFIADVEAAEEKVRRWWRGSAHPSAKGGMQRRTS